MNLRHAAARIWALSFDSDEFETRECNRIAVRMALDELKAKGWNPESEDGQKMIYPGAMAHILDATYEYDCRWDVRFTRWIKGLPPRKRFAAAVEELRRFRRDVRERALVAPTPTQGSVGPNDSGKLAQRFATGEGLELAKKLAQFAPDDPCLKEK